MMRSNRLGAGWSLIGALCLALSTLAALPVEAGTTAAGQSDATAKPSGPVDINDASETELTAIPGIGKTLAQRIVEFRKEHGPFRRVEDLLKVKGIGEKSFAKLRPHVKVGKAG